jgi:hypothetical protein
VIIRAHGGRGFGGFWKAAKRLKVCRMTLHRWIEWEFTPRKREDWTRVDIAYEEAIETLAKEVLSKKKSTESD